VEGEGFEALGVCRALFSGYETLLTKLISTVLFPPPRRLISKQRGAEGGWFRDGWAGARLTKQSAALFRLTYPSAPILFLKI